HGQGADLRGCACGRGKSGFVAGIIMATQRCSSQARRDAFDALNSGPGTERPKARPYQTKNWVPIDGLVRLSMYQWPERVAVIRHQHQILRRVIGDVLSRRCSSPAATAELQGFGPAPSLLPSLVSGTGKTTRFHLAS